MIPIPSHYHITYCIVCYSYVIHGSRADPLYDLSIRRLVSLCFVKSGSSPEYIKKQVRPYKSTRPRIAWSYEHPALLILASTLYRLRVQSLLWFHKTREFCFIYPFSLRIWFIFASCLIWPDGSCYCAQNLSPHSRSPTRRQTQF